MIQFLSFGFTSVARSTSSARSYQDKIVKSLESFIPTDRLQALVQHTSLPERVYGTALFADISGFTPLTEALLKAYGRRVGPEELTHQLNTIYEALIAEVQRYGGSI